MKPADFLKLTQTYADTVNKAVSGAVVVGLPKSQGSKAYKTGVNVVQVGAWGKLWFMCGSQGVRAVQLRLRCRMP